MRQLGKKD